MTSKPPKNPNNLRLTSEVNRFPYGYPGLICYMEQVSTGVVQLRTRDEAREAVARARSGKSQILAVWPGAHRSDLFLVDELPALAQAITLPERKA